MIKHIFLFVAILILLIVPAVIQAEPADLKVKSSVDKNKLSQNATLILKIEITGVFQDSPEIKLPDLKNDFEIFSSGQSQSISIRDKQKKQAVVFEYVLSPKKTGKITIGEVKMNYRGKIYKTLPIDIEVMPSKIKPQPTVPQEENPPFEEGQGTVI